jgi:predicted nucleotidyltransferase
MKRQVEAWSEDQIENFCQKWKITEFSLFGSVLRADFRADSDLDVLVTFAPNAPWTIIDLVTMEQELASLAGREVDLVERRVIEKSHNPIRKTEILSSARVIYSQGKLYKSAEVFTRPSARNLSLNIEQKE